jgi:hypothetical protein
MSYRSPSIDDFRDESLSLVIRHLNDRIIALEEAMLLEDELRQNNPALQAAYEKYKSIKVLFNGKTK